MEKVLLRIVDSNPLELEDLLNNKLLSEKDKAMQEVTESTIKSYEILMDDLKVNEGLVCVTDLLNAANKYIEETTPWVLAKEGRNEELGNVMAILTNTILVATKLLSPVLVETAPKVFEMFSVKKELQGYDSVHEFCPFAGNQVNKGQPLFPRLDVAVETEYINSISKK